MDYFLKGKNNLTEKVYHKYHALTEWAREESLAKCWVQEAMDNYVPSKPDTQSVNY